ncbi:methyltransferase, FkbM family [Lachnospiraceae bacterium C7]|nr:methyltransferase, FkbM family [Lachnospiraceae bacterium C7]
MQNSILPLIKEKNNKFIEKIKECEKTHLPIYIYGAGEGASNISKRFKNINISFAGKVVNRKYYVPGNDYECLEDIIESQKINLVIAHKGYEEKNIENFKCNIENVVDYDCFAGNCEVDPNIMTFEYIKLHDNQLTKIYNSLADNKSKEVLVAYINQKISMDYKYLKSVKSENQYFDNEIIKFSKNEALIDAGAYNGDTAKKFVEILKSNGIESYDAIYSFEPNLENYKELSEVKIKNLYIYNMALSNQKNHVLFLENIKGKSACVSKNKKENIENGIECDSLDNVLHGKKITFIKMDIEGFELEALKGAKEIIKTQRPKLAICIYHKREDLWEIPNYIMSIVDGYEFYIRAYEDTATELVLYALPSNENL